MTQTEAQSTDRHERDRSFVQYLRGLVERDDLAALAALRRGLGKEPGTVPEMFPYVVPFLSQKTPPRDEAAYYLVAALFAWHQNDWLSDDAYTNNLGASLARLRREQATERGAEAPEQGDSTERRFVALLSSTREELPYHLRQMIGLLRTKEVPVNWLQLLRDVRFWDDTRAQKRWASAFWGHTVADQPAPPAGSAASADQATTDESTTN